MSQQHDEIREGDEIYCTKCHKRWGVDEEAPPCVEKEYMTVVFEYDKTNTEIGEVAVAFKNNTTLFGAKIVDVALSDKLEKGSHRE